MSLSVWCAGRSSSLGSFFSRSSSTPEEVEEATMDVQVTNPIHAHANNGKNLINSVKSAAKACLPKAEPRKRPSFNCTSPSE